MKLTELFKAVFSTIRTGNLLMICLTLFLIRYTLIVPLLEFGDNSSSLGNSTYTILVFSVIFIAAGGYVINDFFDTGIDRINKPGKNKIGNVLPRKSTLTIYFILTGAGMVLSWYFGELAGFRYPLLIILLCAGLLYFYSSAYKKMFLLGNIIVAILTSITIFLPLLFDHNARSESPIVIMVSAYAVFSFLLTMIREIIKDCEDVEGDSAFGASTLPILAGLKSGRIVSAVLTIITLCALVWIQYSQQMWDDLLSFLYILIFVEIPMLYLAVKIIKANSKKDDHFNSTLSKLIMVTGILSMPVFYFSFM